MAKRHLTIAVWTVMSMAFGWFIGVITTAYKVGQKSERLIKDCEEVTAAWDGFVEALK